MIRHHLLIVLTSLLVGCAQSVAPVSFTGETMGTQYTVKLTGLPDGITRKTLQSEIDERLERVNDQMSTWRQNSEISRFNQSRKTGWFGVSPATVTVVSRALEISQQTEGAFDVTVGPLVNLWSFGPDAAAESLPTSTQIEQARGIVGYKNLEVRTKPPALRKTHPELYVDLSAIAKGFGVDVIAEHLDSLDVAGYMVEIGGEVRARGTKADGSRWRIGIESPVENQRRVQRAVPLLNKSMATSGDYRNFREIDGKRYSHTIDPRTGKPIEHALASVTVLADDCMTADAWATALMVLGPVAGYNTAEEHELPVLLIVRQANGFTEKATASFDKSAVEPTKNSAMQTFLIVLAVFAAAMLLMAVGVIFSNIRIRGTCGGLSGLKDESGHPLCDVCTTPSGECTGLGKNRLSADDRQPSPQEEIPAS